MPPPFPPPCRGRVRVGDGGSTLLTIHSTMLIGPYDWNSERLPQAEFRERIQTLWTGLADRSCAAAVVYGDSRNHAELGYLSNFVPKLGPAFMFIPRKGEPRLLVSGAPNMLPAARRLTWIEKVEPLRDAGKMVLQWINESAGSGESAARHSIGSTSAWCGWRERSLHGFKIVLDRIESGRSG